MASSILQVEELKMYKLLFELHFRSNWYSLTFFSNLLKFNLIHLDKKMKLNIKMKAKLKMKVASLSIYQESKEI